MSRVLQGCVLRRRHRVIFTSTDSSVGVPGRNTEPERRPAALQERRFPPGGAGTSTRFLISPFFGVFLYNYYQKVFPQCAASRHMGELAAFNCCTVPYWISQESGDCFLQSPFSEIVKFIRCRSSSANEAPETLHCEFELCLCVQAGGRSPLFSWRFLAETRGRAGGTNYETLLKPTWPETRGHSCFCVCPFSLAAKD